MKKNKYLIPDGKDGKDQIGLASKSVIKKLNDVYKEKYITTPCIVIGRSDVIYALIWKHKCGEYVMYSIAPLRHETAQRVVNILRHGVNATKQVRKMQKNNEEKK